MSFIKLRRCLPVIVLGVITAFILYVGIVASISQ